MTYTKRVELSEEGSEAMKRVAMTRRTMLATAGALAGPVLAACATGGGGSAGGPIKPEGGAVDVLIFNPNAARNAIYDAVGKDFTTQTGITVTNNLSAQGLNPVEKLGIIVAAGEKLDLAGVSPLTMPQVASKNWLRDLSGFMARDRTFKQGVSKDLADSFTWKGKPYGLSLYATFNVLAYNKTLFDKGGVKYPDDTWTVDTLRDAAVKLTKATGENDDVYGFDYSLGDWLQFVWQNGGQPFDRVEDPTKSTMSSAPTLEAITYLADLVLKQRVVTRFDAQNRVAMNSGRLAMVQLSLTGLGGLATAAQFPWDIVLFPKGKAGRAQMAGGVGLGVVPTSVRPDAAWTYLSFLCGVPGMRRFVTAQLGAPVHKDLEKDYLALPPPPANRKAVIEAVPTVKSNPRSPNVPPAFDVFNSIFPDILAGKISPKDGCQKIDDQVNPILAAK